MDQQEPAKLKLSYAQAPVPDLSAPPVTGWFKAGIACNVGFAIVGLILLPMGFFQVMEAKIFYHVPFLFAQMMLTLASLMGVHVLNWPHRRRMLYYTLTALVIALLGALPAIVPVLLRN